MALTKRCLKIFLLIYNIVLALCGVCLALFNSFMLYRLVRVDSFLNGQSITSVVSLIVLGVAIVVFAKFGWSATYKEARSQMIAVGLVLALLALCNIGVFVWIITLLHRLKTIVNAGVEKTFHLALDKDAKFVEIWDSMQRELSCCGVGGPTDYRTSQSVPYSCFSGSAVYQHGCQLLLYDKVFDCMSYAAMSSFILALIEILGVVGYFYMVKALRSVAEPPSSPSQSRDSTTRGLLAHMRPQKY